MNDPLVVGFEIGCSFRNSTFSYTLLIALNLAKPALKQII